MDKTKIICYCGSSKFVDEFKLIEYESVVNGFIALLPTFMYEKTLYTPTLDYRNKADELHKRKIDICDEVVVINVNGYFGPSTKNEIEYALSIGKPIKFLYDQTTIEQDQTQVKEKKPLNKVSAKRAVENKEYARLRRDYLEAYPVCEVVECHLPSKEIHHMQGREGDKLNDVNFFLAVCPGHHHKIHTDTQWAKDNGYSIMRSS